MFRVALYVLVAVGLAVAAHHSVVKVPVPDTTKVMKQDTTKVTKGDTTTLTIVNKPEISVIIDTLVITTDTVKIAGKKAPAVSEKAVAPAPAAKPAAVKK
jgi:hypothetical protein